MEYAVVKLAGAQYLVSPNEILSVSNLNFPEGKEFVLEEVLLWKEDGKVEIGTPTVAKKLRAKVLKNFKGEKLDVLKFTAKSRYRRKMGFRPMLSQIQILGTVAKTVKDETPRQISGQTKTRASLKPAKVTVKKTK